MFCGATVGDRTRDLILTMDALYHLSYCGGENVPKFAYCVVACSGSRSTYREVRFAAILAAPSTTQT